MEINNLPTIDTIIAQNENNMIGNFQNRIASLQRPTSLSRIFALQAAIELLGYEVANVRMSSDLEKKRIDLQLAKIFQCLVLLDIHPFEAWRRVDGSLHPIRYHFGNQS